MGAIDLPAVFRRDYHIDETATLGGAMVGLDAAAALGYDEGAIRLVALADG